MARQALSLLKDPRYPAFVERYVLDLPRFCVEVCGFAPTWQQLLFFESVQRPGSRTSVSSGHGTGKSQAFAVCVWWALTVFKYSNTILSGPKLEIVLSGVRKYAADIQGRIETGPYAWLAPHVVIAHKTMYVRGYKSQWWCTAKTAPAGKPEGMAGEHRKFLLWLIDECSGVDDKVMGVILGSLTEEWNRIALASQPTRASGLFYDSHHRMSEGRGGPWRNITMSAEQSPLVSDQFIEEKINQYGGRDDPQYQIKVLGMFPENLEGQLLSRKALENCVAKPSVMKKTDEWGWVVSVDVAAGEERDKSVVMVSKVSGRGQFHEASPRKVHVQDIPICSSTIQPTSLIGEIIRIAAMYPNCIVLVDAVGMGLFVYKKLEELGLPGLIKVNWGAPCWLRTMKETFFNQRAQAMVCAARAAIHGNLSIEEKAFQDMRTRNEFLDQSRIPYHFTDLGQYKIEPKGSKDWEGIPSPDMFDALSFNFLESAIYIPSADSASGKDDSGAVDAAVERMKARRAALKKAAEDQTGEGAEAA